MEFCNETWCRCHTKLLLSRVRCCRRSSGEANRHVMGKDPEEKLSVKIQKEKSQFLPCPNGLSFLGIDRENWIRKQGLNKTLLFNGILGWFTHFKLSSWPLGFLNRFFPLEWCSISLLGHVEVDESRIAGTCTGGKPGEISIEPVPAFFPGKD